MRAILQRMDAQGDLFEGGRPALPGLGTWPDAVTPAMEAALVSQIDAAPLEPFKFGQWTGKRLTASYGSGYDYQRGKTICAPPIPDWMLDLRARLAQIAGLEPDALQQALIIRYDPGEGIGWHRDRPQYGTVLGLSLGTPATLRFRRRQSAGRFDRRSLRLAARSLYRLSGEVRHAWEHSIAPMEQTRWSVTFRTLAE